MTSGFGGVGAAPLAKAVSFVPREHTVKPPCSELQTFPPRGRRTWRVVTGVSHTLPSTCSGGQRAEDRTAQLLSPAVALTSTCPSCPLLEPFRAIPRPP